LSTLRETLSDLHRSLREPPDEIMLEVGAGGEILVARLRLGISALLMLLPLINYVSGGTAYESMVGLGGVGLVLLLSQIWLTLAKQRRRYQWLPFVSAAFDITLVSFVLFVLALNSPPSGLNSMVVWCFYPITILGTALRNDGRVTLLAGGLSIAEFLALAAFFIGTSTEPLISAEYGTVEIGSLLQRALLLLVTTVTTFTIVFRMQRLVQMSGTDGLTGLPNRTYLKHLVPQILVDTQAESQSLCLGLIDLDHFKRINEELGHPVGDRALRHFVDTLRLELGRDEPLIRVGGEEFVLVLSQPLGAAWERMDALRRRLQSQTFLPGDGHEPRTLTFSAGLACSPHDALDVSGLMRTADLRLRTAKKLGRNRIVARDSH
jgi:diguanylate cyclase (GGDEF)-like protein